MTRLIPTLIALLLVGPAFAEAPNLGDFSDRIKDQFKDVKDQFKSIPNKFKDLTSPPKESPAPTAGQKIDVNSASIDELKKLPGIDDVSARKIIDGRPYKGTSDLARRKILPEALYDRIAVHIVARSPEPPSESEIVRPGRQVGFGSADYAALRKAAGAFAERTLRGGKLWRVDLEARYRDGTLQIQEGSFHYFRTDKSGSADLLKVDVRNVAGTDGPRTQEGQYPSGTMGPHIPRWLLVPVPADVRTPEELVGRLNRPLGPDPAGGALRWRLVHFGDEFVDAERRQSPLWMFTEALGARPRELDFLVQTVPHGASTWIWWTVMAQERAYPGSNPKGPGRPRRVEEFLYIDAVTAAVTSACKGPSPSAIACLADDGSSKGENSARRDPATDKNAGNEGRPGQKGLKDCWYERGATHCPDGRRLK